MNERVRIAITLGDPNGIGPEIALKAAAACAAQPIDLTLVGSHALLAEQAARLGLKIEAKVDDPGAAAPAWKPGHVEADAGAAAAAWIRHAVSLAREGHVEAIVTAPICKEALHRGGTDFPGHTELLAALTGTRRYAMMLIGGPLRVVLATCHVPLRRVPDLITRERILETVELAAQSLDWLGAGGNIAVCGVNPHAGENGDLGREDVDVIAPALAQLKARGLPVDGPLPGDTVFHRAARGEFGAVVAMYHDQGLAPLKLIAFDQGVNLTLGLPIIRTSPDHGTAFGIAGRGVAHPSSMIAAIELAAQLARRPNPWRKS